MKIRFIQQFATARQTYRKGSEYDVPDVQAIPLMVAEVAVRTEPPVAYLPSLPPVPASPPVIDTDASAEARTAAVTVRATKRRGRA